MNQALQQRPGFLIRRLHQIHLALFAEECAGFDITPVQYSLMSVIHDQPRLDQAALATQAGIDHATLANVLARLEAKGMLTRARSVADRRQKLVSLTRRGGACLQKIHPAARRAHERTIAALAPAEQALFVALLGRLVAAETGVGAAGLKLP